MFIKDNTLYAGVTTQEGADLNAEHTGYVIQRITDGEILGCVYTMQENENEKMFIETEDNEYKSPFICKDNVIIAGVTTEKGFDLCIKQQDLNTGKTFVRIHDGFKIGNIIHLGIDYSYDKKGRIDKPEYFMEIEEQ